MKVRLRDPDREVRVARAVSAVLGEPGIMPDTVLVINERTAR